MACRRLGSFRKKKQLYTTGRVTLVLYFYKNNSARDGQQYSPGGIDAALVSRGIVSCTSVTKLVLGGSFERHFFEGFSYLRCKMFCWGCSELRCILWTKISSFGNLVTKNATTQKGLQTCFPFEYLLPNSV